MLGEVHDHVGVHCSYVMCYVIKNSRSRSNDTTVMG